MGIRASALRIMQMATPATPAAGESALYPKSDGIWYSKLPSGLEVPLASTGDDTDWIYVGATGAPAFANSWVNYDVDHIHARFRRRDGIVYLEGLVKNGTATNVIFTLPEGFRPNGMPANSTAKLLFPAVNDSGTGGRVDVFPSGAVQHIAGGTAFCSLSAVSFPVTPLAGSNAANSFSEVALTNGAATTAGTGAKAYLRGGMVYLNLNYATTGSVVAGNTLFTVPAGYRPQVATFSDWVNSNTELPMRFHVEPTTGVASHQGATVGSGVTFRGSIAYPALMSAQAATFPMDTGWASFTISTPNIPSTVSYAKYRRVGNTVQMRASLTLTGALQGPALIDPPFPFASDTRFNEDSLVGSVRGLRSGVAWHAGDIMPIVYASVNRFGLYMNSGAGSHWTNGTPAAWASGDRFGIDLEYEAAPL